MKHGGWVLIVTFMFLLTVFVSGERFFSPSFNACIAKHQTQEGSSTSEEHPSGLSRTIDAYVVCSGEFIDAVNGSITAVATLVIAAFTFTLWRATTAQFELARDAFIADKRAFVFASGVQGFYEPDVATGHFNWRVAPHWKNGGDTHTRNLQFYSDGFLTNVLIPSTFDFHQITGMPPGTGMLGPEMSATAGMAPQPGTPALTPQDILDIQSGRKYFYLWGWARYNDTLPGTSRYITRYCWRILSTGNPLTFNPLVDPNGVRFINIYEANGNCADDECRTQGLG
jgi:hypothetical protein